MANVKSIQISDLKHNPHALRQPVDFGGEKVSDADLAFLQDIKENGLSNIFQVVERDGVYYPIDGNRRASAVIHLGSEGNMKDVLVNLVDDMDDMKLLARQVAGNATIKSTTGKEYINALYRLAMGGLSMDELAAKTGMTKDYILKLMGTLKLGTEILDTLGKPDGMGITNAITLSGLARKLEEDELLEYAEKAKTMSIADFTEDVMAKEAEIVEARRGITRPEKTFEDTIQLKLCKRDVLLDMYEKARFAVEDNGDTSERAEVKFNTLKQIFQVDDESLTVLRAEFEKKEAERVEAAKDRKNKRDQKKLADAAADAGMELVPKKDVDEDE